MKQTDQLQKFIFADRNIRGQLVHLRASYQAIVEPQDYPQNLKYLLGESLVASILLSSTLKLSGQLALQCQSDGPVSMLIAKCTNHQQILGLAKYSSLNGDELLSELFSNGQLVITVDGDSQSSRYQSFVPMEGDSLSEYIDNYFAQSEQLRTKLWLHANEDYASGLLLQTLPEESNPQKLEEDWNYAVHMAETLTTHEIMDIDNANLLHRLYHEDDIQLFDAEPVFFRCSCSKEKLTAVISQFSPSDIEEMLDENGNIEATCEFCTQRYLFDKVDIATIFSENPMDANDQQKH